MTRSRQFRFVAALIALFGMLFMQLALASYACPGLQMGQGGEPVAEALAISADVADQGMAGCSRIDKAQPNLCHVHDQVGNQSLDKPGTPQVQPYLAIGLALPLIPVEVSRRPTVTPPEAVQLTRATAPPLSIRNCCFRI